MAKAPTTNRINQAKSRTERAGLRRYLAAAILSGIAAPAVAA
jgi:hypothetical protein